MFYVTYEIGKPGKKERERRHFPWLHNKLSTHQQETVPRSRVYIPHGNSLPQTFQPQMRYIVPEYTETGPDWKSKIRSVPRLIRSNTVLRQPSTEIWDTNHCWMRSFPYTYVRTEKEWFMHPESDKGIKTRFNGTHEMTKSRIFNEENFMKENYPSSSGKRPAHVIDERNGWRLKVPGDKSYSAPEFQPHFYREGAPVSTSVFGLKKERVDTFIPLLGNQVKVSKRRELISREKLSDIQSVVDLDKWQPALPLVKN